MGKTKNPNLYIIAGPNGAGKTTFATEFLPHYIECMEFVNADLIAAGLSPFNPDLVAIRAGRLMIEQIRILANRGCDFGFETTLSGKSYIHFLRSLKKKGYCIYLFYLWVRDIDIALERIAERVKRGGHNVPAVVVNRRFEKGLINLFHLYRPLADFCAIFDNSTEVPYLIGFEDSGELTVYDNNMFSVLTEKLESLCKKKA